MRESRHFDANIACSNEVGLSLQLNGLRFLGRGRIASYNTQSALRRSESTFGSGSWCTRCPRARTLATYLTIMQRRWTADATWASCMHSSAVDRSPWTVESEGNGSRELAAGK
jgi:hypothetical protein